MTTEKCIIELYKRGIPFSEIGDRMLKKGLAVDEISGTMLAFRVIKQALRDGIITNVNEVEND